MLSENGAGIEVSAPLHAMDIESIVSESDAADWGQYAGSLVADITDTAARPFSPLVRPLVGWLRRTVADRVGTILTGRDQVVRAGFGTAAEFADLLMPDILRRLNGMVQRTCLLELAKARESGALLATDERGRFTEFVAGLPARRVDIMRRYPLLARQLAVVADAWLAHVTEFTIRLVDDLPVVIEMFAGGRHPGSVVDVCGVGGDPHRNARTVQRVTFGGGFTIYYKPRPFEADVRFQNLLTTINGWACELTPFRPVRCLDRGSYGWMEAVEAAPCVDRAEAERLYYRYGALLAVLYLVNAGDFHRENLVESAGFPIPIDLETLFQPALPDLRRTTHHGGADPAAEVFSDSVLRTGVLPVGRRPWESAEIPGLGGTARDPANGTAASHATIADVGTDRMRVRSAPDTPATTPPRSATDGDSEFRAIDFLPRIVDGFTDTYRMVDVNKATIGSMLDDFADAEVRVVARETAIYALLLSTSFHPSLLTDVDARDRHFARLADKEKSGLDALLASERRDMWRNDIPVFTVRAGGGPLSDSEGEAIEKVAVTDGLSIVRRRLENWGDADLDRQLWLIRTSVAADAVRSERFLTFARHPSEAAETAGDPRRLTARLETGIDAIADRLASLAIHTGTDAISWLGSSTGISGDWTIGALGPGLYDGALGVAFFLAWHGVISDCPQSTDLAQAAVRGAVAAIDRAGDSGSPGWRGSGGIMFALAGLGQLWSDQSLFTAADSIATKLTDTIRTDRQYEVMAGAAGAIIGAAALHRTTGSGPACEAIAAAADHLINNQRQFTVGASWLPPHLVELGVANRPLAGMAHGTAGIAYALSLASEATGSTEYFDAIEAALTYERSLADAENGGWRDIRITTSPDSLSVRYSDQNSVERAPVAWCHGAVGIGLSRLLMPTHRDTFDARAEVSMAVEQVLRPDSGAFGNDHSLCHGDAGALDFLLTVSADDPSILDRVRRHAVTVLDTVDAGGWNCGLHAGVEVAGLFTGISGLGLTFARLLSPTVVPSVLGLPAKA